jgi:hypothetical protein
MPGITWQKSSFSNEQDGCVELASADRLVHIREGDIPDVVVRTSRVRLGTLLSSVKAGRFDHLGASEQQL